MALRARVSYFGAALIAAAVLAVVAGVGRSAADHRTPPASLAGAAVPAVNVGGRASVRTTAANRRAAIRDSAQLLAEVVPPPGAVVLSKHSGVGIQRAVPVLTPAFSSALASERWSAPGQSAAVLAYVEAHLPPGSKVFSTGSGGSTPGFQSVIRSWAPIVGELDTRWLEIEVAARADGGTNLFAESQSQWVVARPSRERIPEGATEVDVTDGLPSQPPLLSRRVTAPARVKRLVALFNSLEIAQPVAINCPAETAQPIVTVTFRRASDGRALAVATVDSTADFSFPISLPGWDCSPIGFTVGGRTSDSLIGNVITPLDQMLRLRLERRR